MKNFILTIILYIARTVMRLIYFFIKIFTRQKNKVTFLSRQSDTINLDFRLLREMIDNETTLKTEVLCKKIPNNIMGKINYCFYIVKCMYHIATSKVCIIDGYNIPISSLKHKKNLEIIQIWHAMGAIKKFGYQTLDMAEGDNRKIAKIMKMHSGYTCITCTSSETRKTYSQAFNTDIERIKVMGMPRIDYILDKNNIIKWEKTKKTILYVPTFRKNETLNVQELIDSINKDKYNLIIKLHPLDKTKVDEKYTSYNKYNTIDLIKVSDYIITDYSAVAFEVATLNKPLFFYLYDIEKYENARGLNINLKEEMKNSTKTNIKDIISIIENDTYDYEELKKFKEKYVETADTNNTKRIVNYILEKINMKKETKD